MPDLRNLKTWRKSTKSTDGNNCVEVCYDEPGFIAVRNSRLGDASPVNFFDKGEWDAFRAGMDNGEFPSP